MLRDEKTHTHTQTITPESLDTAPEQLKDRSHLSDLYRTAKPLEFHTPDHNPKHLETGVVARASLLLALSLTCINIAFSKMAMKPDLNGTQPILDGFIGGIFSLAIGGALLVWWIKNLSNDLTSHMIAEKWMLSFPLLCMLPISYLTHRLFIQVVSPSGLPLYAHFAVIVLLAPLSYAVLRAFEGILYGTKNQNKDVSTKLKQAINLAVLPYFLIAIAGFLYVIWRSVTV